MRIQAAVAALCLSIGLGCSLAGAAHAAAIFIMRPDGTEVRKVVQVEGCGGHGSPRFSHDDKRLVFDASTGGTRDSRFFVVNLDGTGLKQLGAHAMPDWSPDDKQVAFHNYGGNAQAGVHVQNLDSQGRVFISEGGSPRWSPDGGQIAITDWNTVRVIDLVEGEQRRIVDEPFEGYQIGFDWSPDGKRIAFVGQRNQADELWIASTEPGPPKAHMRYKGDLSTHVAWSRDGKQIAVTIDGKIHLMDADGTEDPKPIPGQVDRSGDVAWSHDGRWIAFASNRPTDGKTQSADKSKWTLTPTGRPRGGGPAYGLAVSSDGTRAILGGYTGKAGFEVWDIEADSVVHHNIPGVFVALAPDNRTAAVTGLDIKFQLVDLETGDVKRTQMMGGVVTSLRFSKDGQRLVTTTLARRAHVWNVADGKSVCVFNKHEGIVFHAQFTPDGKEGVSVGQDKTLRVWNAAIGAQRLVVPHPELICGLALTPDGLHALTGTGGAMSKNPLDMTMDKGQDNVLRMWELSTGKLVREMKGHAHAVYAIDVAPDGRLAVSGGWDGTVRVWDLNSGEEVAQAQLQGSVMDVKFSPDGKRILVGGGANRYLGQEVQYFGGERARLYQLTEEEKE